MSFQKIAVISAIVILIVSLTFMGWAMYKSQRNATFPPVVGNCPDYWAAKDGLCENPLNLGTCGSKPKDFNQLLFQGDQGSCMKKRWANGCNVAWDGIANNN